MSELKPAEIIKPASGVIKIISDQGLTRIVSLDNDESGALIVKIEILRKDA